MGQADDKIKIRILLAAVLLLSPHAAIANASWHTAASVEIREAAGVSVLSDAPLKLLLTSGASSSVAFAVLPAPAGSPAIPMTLNSESLLMGGSGLIAAMTNTGEVLSVSMGSLDNSDAVATNGRPKVRVVIAQFN